MYQRLSSATAQNGIFYMLFIHHISTDLIYKYSKSYTAQVCSVRSLATQPVVRINNTDFHFPPAVVLVHLVIIVQMGRCECEFAYGRAPTVDWLTIGHRLQTSCPQIVLALCLSLSLSAFLYSNAHVHLASGQQKAA